MEDVALTPNAPTQWEVARASVVLDSTVMELPA